MNGHCENDGKLERRSLFDSTIIPITVADASKIVDVIESSLVSHTKTLMWVAPTDTVIIENVP